MISRCVEQARAIYRDGPTPRAGQRSQRRFDLDGLRVSCTIHQPGGSRHDTFCYAVDVSSGGMKVLHPGYLHPETRFVVRIAQPHRPRHSIDAHVMWCRFIEGRMHVVGLAADEPIVVRDMVDPDQWVETCSAGADAMLPIGGTLLSYCENAMSRSAIELHMNSQEMETRFVSSTGALADEIERARADVVVLDVDS